MINPVFPLLAAASVIIVIAGYIIAKKMQVKLKWWFPFATIAVLWIIILITGFLLHAFNVME